MISVSMLNTTVDKPQFSGSARPYTKPPSPCALPVIVKVTPDCPKGHDALVAVDGAAVLRQVDYDQVGSITLKAYNPEYPPKSFGPKDERVTILGIVREMRRDIAIP